MKEFWDRVNIERETSAEGAETPTYTPDALEILGKITAVRGAETFKGRQLIANADYVFEAWYTENLGSLPTTARLIPETGIFKSRILNVAAVDPVQDSRGRPPMVMITCREGKL